jgi:pimeloyl-ACP methyl ester carboxylesterase
MRNQPPSSVVHLNRYYHFTELMRDPAIEGRLLRYRSAFDGSSQSVLTLQPADAKPERLFFFFHGMDGDSGDGVILRNLVKDLKAAVVCPGGRGPAWVSDAFIADAEQVIRDHRYEFDSYYLIGVSMGGTQALSLAGLAPADLRKAIAGVFAIIPGVNLTAILARSANERVRQSLQSSANGDIAALEQRSPTMVIGNYTPKLPFVIFHNREDTLLLADELQNFVSELRKREHPVASLSAAGDHNFTYENFDFAAAFRRLGRDVTESEPPLRTG